MPATNYETIREVVQQMEGEIIGEFAQTWRTTFEEPVSVRTAIEKTQTDLKFREALLLAIPNFAALPTPRNLTNWLVRHENLPLGSAGRFVRVGHRWRVVEPLTIAA